MPHENFLGLGLGPGLGVGRTLGLAACLLALACDEQPGTEDREALTSITHRATNAALAAKAAQADAQGAVGAATVVGAGAPDEGLDMDEPDEIQSGTDQPAPDAPLPREPIKETATPPRDATSETAAERARKDGADPISREPPRPR